MICEIDQKSAPWKTSKSFEKRTNIFPTGVTLKKVLTGAFITFVMMSEWKPLLMSRFIFAKRYTLMKMKIAENEVIPMIYFM